jgi:hypothetical protein
MMHVDGHQAGALRVTETSDISAHDARVTCVLDPPEWHPVIFDDP